MLFVVFSIVNIFFLVIRHTYYQQRWMHCLENKATGMFNKSEPLETSNLLNIPVALLVMFAIRNLTTNSSLPLSILSLTLGGKKTEQCSIPENKIPSFYTW